MSSFGRFSADGTEYIVTTPQTPRPLMNYAWNPLLLSGFNHFGGGEGAYGGRAASYIDPDERGRAVLIRSGNRYFYVRDEETGVYWNPGWYPARRPLDAYQCTHGTGYTVVEGVLDGIRAAARGFVNAEDPAEIWTVTLGNTSERSRTLRLYAFVEFSLEGYARYSEYDSYVTCEYDSAHRMLVAHNRAQERPHGWFDGFVASSVPVAGYDSSRRAFLGRYGDIAAPEAVARGSCSGSLAACERMVGVLEVERTLAPGETAVCHFLFGATDSTERAARLVEKLFAEGRIEADFAALKEARQRMEAGIRIRTPDSRLNPIINTWVKQQVALCAEAGRATGKGFRDQLQDGWAVAAFNPSLARRKMLETLRHEYADGRCVRGWLPLDPHIYSDGPTWIAPAVNAYIKETGDTAFLEERAPYLHGGDGTVWEHILTAVRYSSDDTGVHGLVRAHDGDWNDSLNGIGVAGRGESVWTSIALCLALADAAELAGGLLGDQALERELLERADRMRCAVNDTGWDGAWYLAGYDDEGRPVGSRTEQEGSIYLNSQTWAVLAGVATGERAAQCLRAVDERLDSPYGPLTLNPPYTAYNPAIGRLTGFVPGIWENGTPYCHGGAFKIVADCCAGRAERAWESLQKIMPDSRWNPSAHSGCEPYVFTNMYFGPENPRAGETSFAWVTGTAGWMLRAVTQYMFGFHPAYNGFSIRPCVPAAWGDCELLRQFRGDTYVLHIRRRGPNGRVARLFYDGAPVGADRLPLAGDGGEHRITVELE